MKIKWLGHAAFLITSDSGIRIITDPYQTSESLTYGEIKESADIVTVSHGHFDHANVAAVSGRPQVLKGAGQAKGIRFEAVSTHHDDAGGSKRGDNNVFCFGVDGIRVCHLGDLGHRLGDKELKAIGKVDVLLVPVGGFFTIDAAVATDVASKLSSRIVIPMHYKNDKCALPIASVEEFLKGKDNVTRLGVSEAEFHSGLLPSVAQIVVLEPAL